MTKISAWCRIAAFSKLKGYVDGLGFWWLVAAITSWGARVEDEAATKVGAPRSIMEFVRPMERGFYS